MNKTVSTTLLGCLLLVLQAPALAQATDADHHPDSSSPETPAPESRQGNTAPTIQQMQAGMKDMQELMNRINTTKDPNERKTLLDQHMQAMQKQMNGMSGMMGRSMMTGQDAGASTGTAANCQSMMGGDLSMMKAMMEQMMQHEAATK